MGIMNFLKSKEKSVIIGDYIYSCRSNGWKVDVLDRNKTEYGPIESVIDGIPVTNMHNTFRDCKNLVIAPEIPSFVTNMSDTFNNCTSLTTAPEIPSIVIDMSGTFESCTSLTTAPEIPQSVTNMQNTFKDCTSLTTAPVIPNNVTNMHNTFRNCKNLVIAPEIPYGVTKMYGTFCGCENLTTVSKIPNTVNDMCFTFRDCKNLTDVPYIPDVINPLPKAEIFDGCDKLERVAIGDYVYYLTETDYGIGWDVDVLDRTKTKYEPIKNQIGGKPTIAMFKTFANCKEMLISPKIPETVDICVGTYSGCEKLKIPPNIPQNVKYIKDMFTKSGIEIMPNIPDSAEIEGDAFDGCFNLPSIAQDILSDEDKTSYNFTTNTDEKGHNGHDEH